MVDAWRPDWVFVENVPEFLLWDRYPAWRMDLTCMGYNIAHAVLDAADFGYAPPHPYSKPAPRYRPSLIGQIQESPFKAGSVPSPKPKSQRAALHGVTGS
jgi:hypothetical protein